MSAPVTVSVYSNDDPSSAPIGTAALVLGNTILLDPALAATLLREHGVVGQATRPVQALVRDAPLTVRITGADGAPDEIRRTDGMLHLAGGPGVPPLVAADLDTASGAPPTDGPDLPAALRDPLTALGSLVDDLPRPPAPGSGPDEGFVWCSFFPWLRSC